MNKDFTAGTEADRVSVQMRREQKEMRWARRSLAGVFHQKKLGNWVRRERKRLKQFVQKGQEDSVNTS